MQFEMVMLRAVPTDVAAGARRSTRQATSPHSHWKDKIRMSKRFFMTNAPLSLFAVGVLGLWAVSLPGCDTDTSNVHAQGASAALADDGAEHDYAADQHGHTGHDHGDDADDADEKTFVGDAYPLNTCPVSGQPLDSMGGPVSYVHEGREIKFCCAGCDERFEADPAAHLAAIDEQIIEQQKEHSPLQNCPISGAELGSMGEPVDYVWHNRLVRFCCAGCIDDFEHAAEAHVAKLDEAAIEAQRDDYPLDVCVVSNEPLDAWGEPIDVVVADRLVRMCCEGCVEDLEAYPARVLAALDRGEPLETAGHDHEHGHGHGGHDHGHDHGHEDHHQDHADAGAHGGGCCDHGH